MAALAVYSVATVLFGKIPLSGSGAPIEPTVFLENPLHLLLLAAVALVTSALCRTLRTNAMKYIEASAVAVIMPFSSVVTGIVSIISGTDSLSLNLVLGGALSLAAIFMAGFAEAS